MPYIIEAQAKDGTQCKVSFRVKRDAFAVAQMCACLLHFSDEAQAQLRNARLGPDVTWIQVEGTLGIVKVARTE